MTTVEYCSLLSTYSDHSTLPQDQREGPLADLAGAIDAHGGGASLAYQTGLFLTRTTARAG